MNRKVLFGALTVLVVMAGVMVAYCVETFTQTLTWTYNQTPNPSFEVTAPASDLGTITDIGTKTATYTVQNNGNVEITVLASATPTAGASASWDKTTATLAVGETTTFVLTLNINGAGSCPVTFTKQ